MGVHVVLVEPEIPQNSGNVARTCALTCSTLHLVRPLGFSLEDRYLKRAGLDYWDKVEVKVWDSFQEVEAAYPDLEIYLATTHAERSYHEVSYGMNTMLVLGRESKGLPENLMNRYPERRIRIPMLDIGRSLNLSNAAAILMFEVLRQNGFAGLK
ncbi:MAG TPA: tRNA (cytidine(34)-2'-O)-methyltransferase [Syntrophomonadaceae bacterium]|nr:tRNA (cytidine(34)-2'-O)-methyltransferase [Syntrophomonadaceae bacterium]